MDTLAVVEALDEFKDLQDGLFSGNHVPEVKLPFQDGKKRFRRGIVITISPA